MFRLYRYIIISLCLCILFIPSVQAAKVYVSPDNSNEVSLEEEADLRARFEALQQKIIIFDKKIEDSLLLKNKLQVSIDSINARTDITDWQKSQQIKEIERSIKQVQDQIDIHSTQKTSLEQDLNLVDNSLNLLSLKETKKKEIQTEQLYDTLQEFAGIAALVVVTFLVGLMLKRIVRASFSYKKRRKLIVNMVTIGIGFLMSLEILLYTLSDLSYFLPILALFGTALAFGLRDTFQSLVGWFFINGPRGFEVGDIVEVEGVKGYVSNIDLFRFSIKEITDIGFSGNVCIFYNSTGIAIKNYTKHSNYFFDTISLTCKDMKEAKQKEKKLLDALRPYYDTYLDAALEKWKKIPDHPYPYLDSEHTRTLLGQSKEGVVVTLKFVSHIDCMTELRKSLYEV